jgi:hypothetical protein
MRHDLRGPAERLLTPLFAFSLAVVPGIEPAMAE